MSDDNNISIDEKDAKTVENVQRVNTLLKMLVRSVHDEINAFDLVSGISFTLGEFISCVREQHMAEAEIERVNKLIRKGLEIGFRTQQEAGLRPADEAVTQ